MFVSLPKKPCQNLDPISDGEKRPCESFASYITSVQPVVAKGLKQTGTWLKKAMGICRTCTLYSPVW